MPYRTRGIRPNIVSVKHVVDVPTSVVTGIVTVIPIADTVDNPILAGVADVATGSRINAFYLRVEVLAVAGFTTVPRVYMALFRNPGTNLANPEPSSLGNDDRKKFIIHQEMTMVAGTTDVQIPRTMFEGVIRIPPKYRRNGHDDRWNLLFQHESGETTAITNVCIQAIYKEFR